MGADYRDYKTPYFSIEIGDSNATNKLYKLPYQIQRLIEKVEIVESLEQDTYTSMSITFVEGSREPSSTSASVGTNGLYKVTSDGEHIDTSISGLITNRSGSIVDLRWNGPGGITHLTSSEQKAGKVDNTPQKNVEGKVVTRTHKNEHPKITFLLQERNIVRVTWGYLEQTKKRSISGYIATIHTTFPDNGPTITTVTCLPTKSLVDQLARTKGKKFGTVSNVKGNSIVDFIDDDPYTLLKGIADSIGATSLISKNLLGPKLDNGKQKMWIGGESFKQFMDRLAIEHDSMWDITLDPKTHKNTLIFISLSEFMSRLVISDRDLTTYKAPGSLIKNITVEADFSSIVGNMVKGVDKNKEVAGEGSDYTNRSMFKGQAGKLEQQVPTHPVTSGNAAPSVESMHDRVTEEDGSPMAGRVEYQPTTVPDRRLASSLSAIGQNDKSIVLSFTMIGFPFITPGAVEFRNIGVRYSGKYRVLSVTHTIDNSGYIVTGKAIAYTLAKGGVTLIDTPKEQDPPDVQIKKKVFKPSPPKTASIDSPIDEYLKFKQV